MSKQRNTVTILDPTDPAVIAGIDFAAIERKLSVKPLACGRCEACNKVLEEQEMGIKGYATGFELGLCRRCAGHVNTPEAIDAAEAAGHKVHVKPIRLSPEGKASDHLNLPEDHDA